MNNFGRKMVRSLMLGGAIALGFATNSTDVKAAETTDEGTQLQLEDVSADTNAIIEAESEDDGLDEIGEYWKDPDTISEYREDMQRLRDAADVIEGDAVAEEGYLDAARTAEEAGTLTQDQSEELISGGNAVLEQAEEKISQVQDAYDSIRNRFEAVDDSIKNGYLKEEYFVDCAERYESTTDIQEKIDIVKEAHQLSQDRYGRLSEDAELLNKKLEELRTPSPEALAAVEEAEQEYDELKKQYDDIRRELDKFSSEVDVNRLIEDVNSYDSQIQKLNCLKAEYEACCAKFDEVYYARAGYEEQVTNTASERENALTKIRNSSAEASDEELSAMVTECAEIVKKYNEAVSNLEKWYADLDTALDARQSSKEAYENQNSYLNNYISDGVLEKYNYYQDLSKRATDTKRKENSASKKVEKAKKALDNWKNDTYYQKLSDDLQCIWYEARAIYLNSWYLEGQYDYYIRMLNFVKSAEDVKNTAYANLTRVRSTNSQLTTGEVPSQSDKEEADELKDVVEAIRKASDNLEYVDTLDEATTISNDINKDYDEIDKYTEALAQEFVKKAQELGLDEYVEKINSAQDDEQKIKIIDKVINHFGSELESYYYINNLSSPEYDKILSEINKYWLDWKEVTEAYVEASKNREELASGEAFRLANDVKEAEAARAEKDKAVKKLQKEYLEVLRTGISDRCTTSEDLVKFGFYANAFDEAIPIFLEAEGELGDNITKENLDKYIDAYAYLGETNTKYAILHEKCLIPRTYSSSALLDIQAEIENLEEGYTQKYATVIAAYNKSSLKEADDKLKDVELSVEELETRYNKLYQKMYDILLDVSEFGTKDFFKTAEKYKQALSYRTEAEKIKIAANKAVEDNKLCDVNFYNSCDYDIYYKNKPAKVFVTIACNTVMYGKYANNPNIDRQMLQVAKKDINATVTVKITNADGVIASTVKDIVVKPL